MIYRWIFLDIFFSSREKWQLWLLEFDFCLIKYPVILIKDLAKSWNSFKILWVIIISYNIYYKTEQNHLILINYQNMDKSLHILLCICLQVLCMYQHVCTYKIWYIVVLNLRGRRTPLSAEHLPKNKNKTETQICTTRRAHPYLFCKSHFTISLLKKKYIFFLIVFISIIILGFSFIFVNSSFAICCKYSSLLKSELESSSSSRYFLCSDYIFPAFDPILLLDLETHLFLVRESFKQVM